MNGTSLRNFTHAQALALLRDQPPFVRLQIRRDPMNIKLLDLFAIQAIEDISIELPANGGGAALGVHLASKIKEPGVFITRIFEDSVAAVDDGLLVGDRLLKINGADVSLARPKLVGAMLKVGSSCLLVLLL